MITQGDADHPVKLNDHIFGPKIKEVHWGGFALLEIKYPSDFEWHFSVSETLTTKRYAVGDLIDRAGIDIDAPLIKINFREDNPISETTTSTGFRYEQIFVEAVLLVQPRVEVIETIEIFRVADQARADADVATQNAEFLAQFNSQFDPVFGSDALIHRFMVAHPSAAIIRNVMDLRSVSPDHSPVWPDSSITYLPDGQWFRIFGGAPRPPHANEPATFTFPSYQIYETAQAEHVDRFFNVPPIRTGIAYGKYPISETDRQDRDCYAVNLAKLGTRTIDIIVDEPSRNIDSAVSLDFFSQGGTFTTATHRTIALSESHSFHDTRAADGKSPVGTIIARFNRQGFVALT